MPHASANAKPADALPLAPLQVWGGVEYTCNRVGDRYFDQMELSGHAARIHDLHAIAALGIRTLRCGVLWERHERDRSWAWTDACLHTMRAAGIRPIAGLLHHGSGPPHTSLLDPDFPKKLAAFAARVAQRYPWIDAYTPVNEPHTTARFSALYGIWFPHHRSRRSYLRAVLQQVKATVLCMAAIRRVNPHVQLVQTEDVGVITGTSELQPVCELLSERRWLPFDLLCGRVDRHHPLFDYMLAEGIAEHELMWFCEQPCPPSTIGINYYVTSDRFLDHRVDRYAEQHRSGEGPFVDVEAVRAAEGIRGLGPLLQEAWERYGLPLAVTEVHLGGESCEQVRWLAEIWSSVQTARNAGVPCVALTVWALMGSFYWDCLVTSANGHYEPGVFDVRGAQPRATELACIVKQIASGREPCHASLGTPGWWRRSDRVRFPPAG